MVDSPNPPASGRVPGTLVLTAGITWRLLVVIAGLLVAGYVLDLIFPVAFALFFALLVTAWTQPIMNLIHRWLPKVISMVLALFIILTLVVVIVGAVVSSSIQEGPKLVASIQSGFKEIETWLKTGPLQMSDANFNNLLTEAQSWGKNFATGLLGDAVGALGSVGTLVIAGSVFFYAVVFFLLTPKAIWGWLMSWMPSGIRTPVNVSGTLAWDAISGYTRGIVVVAFADAMLVFIGLLILQVPLAPALAALVFLGAFIPVIGAPVATFFAAIVALAERGPLVALLVVGLTVLVGSFDGDVLQPLVMGKAVNLHPLAIVFSIAAGSIILGIVGALIAVPIAGAIYKVAKYLTGRDPDNPYPPPPAPPDTADPSTPSDPSQTADPVASPASSSAAGTTTDAPSSDAEAAAPSAS
jgi:predicted PurR-regulated permease PerM